MEKRVLVMGIVIVLVLIAGFFLMKSYSQSSTLGKQGTEVPITKGVPPGSNFYDVAIKGFSFQPETLTIKVNDTVTWVNEDSMEHTITSDTGEEVNSLSLGNRDTYVHTFETAGTYEYHCSIHGSMKGTVIVA